MKVLSTHNPSLISWNLTHSLSRNHHFCIHNSTLTKLLSFSSSSSFSIRCSSSSSSNRPLRYAILGAGFAGLSVTWHLLQQSCRESRLSIDIYDEVGVGGGASGVSGGLLHPYSPKVKLLWGAIECWSESLNLITIAENAHCSSTQNTNSSVVRRRGILRPATSMKNLDTMKENAQSSLPSCRIESINEDSIQKLVPNLFTPYNLAFYMPEAVNIHPQPYLQGLFLACENFVKSSTCKELCLHKKPIERLLDLEGEYDAVIICLGARAAFLPELSGKLPLRTCRGVVAHLHLEDYTREEYPDHGPSILSDAWVAVQGSRDLHVGSTWEWNSINYSRDVTVEEKSKALNELILKASGIYPNIKQWKINGASAGLRGMPPVTPYGSLPLLGCVDDLVGGNSDCKYWVFTGLGARGLLYHGWLGKLIAQAVLSCKEDLIPSQFVSWKCNIKS